MNISIILAHPDPGSFNHAIANTAAETLRRNSHTVTLHDLCLEKFPPLLVAAFVWSLFLPGLLGGEPAGEIYFNDFNGPPGSVYPEWVSSPTTYASSTNPPGSGILPPQPVTNTDATNGAQRFLGEFGGARIGRSGDPGYNRTRVDQTISLTLTNLPPHSALRLTFDLLVLKSWDGNSPIYGPDRWTLSVAGGPVLLDATFSNNPKVGKEGSHQNYPQPQAMPRTGATRTNTLGYAFFGDSIYPLEFTFPHSDSTLELNFRSSLFEGKGLTDESWGLDNVRLVIAPNPPPSAPGTKSKN